MISCRRHRVLPGASPASPRMFISRSVVQILVLRIRLPLLVWLLKFGRNFETIRTWYLSSRDTATTEGPRSTIASSAEGVRKPCATFFWGKASRLRSSAWRASATRSRNVVPVTKSVAEETGVCTFGLLIRNMDRFSEKGVTT